MAIPCGKPLCVYMNCPYNVWFCISPICESDRSREQKFSVKRSLSYRRKCDRPL
ncbi:hypothetical protein H6G91_11925 [Nostoc muscorum FACHB-395]|nr:hypothetical protein [Desmonostoc muscorum FACHB-395]